VVRAAGDLVTLCRGSMGETAMPRWKGVWLARRVTGTGWKRVPRVRGRVEESTHIKRGSYPYGARCAPGRCWRAARKREVVKSPEKLDEKF